MSMIRVNVTTLTAMTNWAGTARFLRAQMQFVDGEGNKIGAKLQMVKSFGPKGMSFPSLP